MAGREFEVAQLRAVGGLSTRGACYAFYFPLSIPTTVRIAEANATVKLSSPICRRIKLSSCVIIIEAVGSSELLAK